MLQMMKRFIFLILSVCLLMPIQSASAATSDFKNWLEMIAQEAVASGIAKKSVTQSVKTIRFMPEVIELDRAQPEFIHTFLSYYHNHITPSRVKAGQYKLRHYRTLLRNLEKQYGVPKSYLVAFWGLETNYGKFQGNNHTLSALATLAYEGRRAAFFKQQLIDALRIIANNRMHARNLKGSWAGAFGHMQFMPSTFVRYAVDGDGNRRIDLQRSIPDALKSGANYLSTVGWHPKQPTVVQVKLPAGFRYETAHLNHRQPVSAWSALGVKAVKAKASITEFTTMYKQVQKQAKQGNRAALPGLANKQISILPLASLVKDQTLNAAILLPQGWQGPAFMVFDNFDTILDWNRSVNYALSIALLANQLQQQAVLAYGGLAEKGALSYQQTHHLQSILNAFGFDSGTPDGYPGLQTQHAIRQYQLSQALPADGYASPSLYHHLDANISLSSQ